MDRFVFAIFLLAAMLFAGMSLMAPLLAWSLGLSMLDPFPPSAPPM